MISELRKELKEKYNLDVDIGTKIVIPNEFPATEKFYTNSRTLRLKQKWKNKKVTISNMFRIKTGQIGFVFLETKEGMYSLQWLAEDFSIKKQVKKLKLSNKDLFGI